MKKILFALFLSILILSSCNTSKATVEATEPSEQIWSERNYTATYDPIVEKQKEKPKKKKRERIRRSKKQKMTANKELDVLPIEEFATESAPPVRSDSEYNRRESKRDQNRTRYYNNRDQNLDNQNETNNQEVIQTEEVIIVEPYQEEIKETVSPIIQSAPSRYQTETNRYQAEPSRYQNEQSSYQQNEPTSSLGEYKAIIFFKNGAKMNGRVTELQGGAVTIKLPGGAVMKSTMKDIDKIERQ